ncbi:MAG: hypothetical protein ABSE40_17290 [Candidatus Sulfotelmatobacter sp.]
MGCQQRDELEETLMAIREQGRRLAFDGKMTDELLQAQAAQEAEAIQALTDHTAEHGCRGPGE